jgi:cytochrome c oxidase cbb3-type subunit 4
MKSEVLKAFPWTGLTCLGLIIFFVFFLGVVIWVIKKNQQNEFSSIKNLPLHEDGL